MHSTATPHASASPASLRSTSRRDHLRQCLALALGGTLAGAGLSARAQGGAYPDRPIRMFVAFPAGGATDILARMLGQSMGGHLKQSVVVENKPGAGGMIGLEAGAKSPPDGYSLLLCALTNQAIAGNLYPKATSDITRDFEPVALVANGAHVLNVHPSVPARNMGEFVAWLKAGGGKINYASQGSGTLSHLEAELLLQTLGTQAVHVPYRGSSQALPDLIAGQVSFMFDSVAASQPFLKTGQLRALAVTTGQRVPAYPDLPTVEEAGVKGYNADNWFGLYAPKGTPPDIRARLADAVQKSLNDKALADNLLQKGFVVSFDHAERLAALTASDRAKWGGVIRSANITL
ncbi:tripartite tricarboxylate transporter substrate binding protein [Diaphorobacter ruginosibacter]|uniref:Tripartite tricarboxylate transporter substrate binding protein n=1 Tax=Diaphorobacter ruginosibacter TaxID=1715720 RepID=A0A7G9RL76_9BURK|nr:tripartite tricarboxylate transporter substrate binding protein [Diaphorobacter ruginosibacter]QNN56351.1 tripartite tricarboxylate transporter substrate binding protein [Diaphorobacter ruginosibacter]